MKNHVPKQSVGDGEDTNVKNLTEPVGEGHDPPLQQRFPVWLKTLRF
mgnify:CR=1 FL=1